MSNEITTKMDEIKSDIEKHPIILYMKGNKMAPQCGFSAQVVAILEHSNVEFETRNVLEDELLRHAIKEFSDWPTIPQLYVNGEFIGGCDIVTELYQNGELENILSTQ